MYIYWQFSVTLKSDGYLSGHTSLLVVFTTSSLGGIYAHECNPYNTGSGTNKQITSSATVIIPLTSGDTVKVEIRSAGGTKVVDVASTSTFSGRFIG
jgi:hypothetical protein